MERKKKNIVPFIAPFLTVLYFAVGWVVSGQVHFGFQEAAKFLFYWYLYLSIPAMIWWTVSMWGFVRQSWLDTWDPSPGVKWAKDPERVDYTIHLMVSSPLLRAGLVYGAYLLWLGASTQPHVDFVQMLVGVTIVILSLRYLSADQKTNFTLKWRKREW